MYRNLNDYEILYMVSDARENNFDILLIKYKPLIYKIVKDYAKLFKRFGYELDDLMQVGYITLYKSSYLYDIYDQSMFYTYFKKALNNAIISCIKNNSTNKREVLNNALSYEVEIPNSNIRYLDLFADSKSNLELEKELIIFKNSMPVNLSWIFELFYNGYSKDEISILLDEEIADIKKDFLRIKEHALTYKGFFFG